MDAEIDDGASAGLRSLGEPTVDTVWCSPRPHPHGFSEIDLSQPPLFHEILGRLHGRRKTHLPAEIVNESTFLCFFVESAHLPRVHGRWFFAEDMFAGL